MNSTKLPKVRENAGVQIVIDFSFHPIGLESDASFVDQPQSEVMQKQSYSGLLFDTHLKIALSVVNLKSM